MLTLVLGGARSGKSRYAESLCGESPVVYVATALATDPEMEERILKHHRSRPVAWTTIEEPLYVAEAVARARPDQTLVIVDCVTVWLANLMWEHRELNRDSLETTVLDAVDGLSAAASDVDVIAVSNEVGNGIVPSDPLGRHFRDLQGFANQRLAHAAERVVWLVAGLPIILKDPGLKSLDDRPDSSLLKMPDY